MIYDKISSFLKEDVTKEQIEGALKGYVNPGELSKEGIKELIKESKDFASLFDSEVNTRRDTGVDNWKEKEIPKLRKEIEEEARQKYNPEETAVEKQLREANERISAMENKEQLSEMMDALSGEGKELGFEPLLSRKLAKLGDDATPFIKEVVAWKDALLGETKKAQFNQKQPKTGGIGKGLANMSDNELNAAAISNPSMKPAILEEVKRRIQPT